MPNLYTHISFGREVIALLPEEVASVIKTEQDAYELGCLGPDFLFILRETGVGNVPDYAVKMHYTRVYEAFNAIESYLKERCDCVKLAYALGLMCHYVLDSSLHPYVFETTTRYASELLPKEAAPKAHHFIESAIDEYYITDKGIKDGHKIKAHGTTVKAIGELYQEVINPIFDEDLSPSAVKFAFNMAKFALKISRDTKGSHRKTIRSAEKIFFKGAMKFSPLVRPPIGNGEIDYFNKNRRPFGIDRDGDETETLTVYELLDRAYERATKYIPLLYDAVSGGAELPPGLFAVNYEGQRTLSDND